MDFREKTVVITGGASGMRLFSGLKFYELGANVVLCDRDQTALKKVSETFGKDEKLLTITCDVRNFEEVKNAVEQVDKIFGTLDVMINCAGGNSCRVFGHWDEFSERPIEEIRWGMEVNLMGVIYFCHEAMHRMKKQKSGVIINFGSITGLEGDIGGLDYAVSKCAIMNALNKCLAKEGAPHGVRVNCIAPGPVLTRPGMANMKTPLGRAADPQEIVDMVLYLASDKSSFVTDSTFLMDGGRHLMMNE